MIYNQRKAGAVLSYVSIGLSNVMGLLFTPFLLRMLGQSEYGLYSLVASVVAYLTVMDFGFGNAIVRYTAKYKALGNTEEQYSLFGMFLLLYCAIGVLALITGMGLYLNVNNLFGSSMNSSELAKAKIMMLLLVFNLAFTFPLSIFGSIINAYENFVFQKLINILRVLIYPCIMIPLLMTGHKAITVVVITTILNMLTLVMNYWYCMKKLKIQIHFHKFEWGLLKEISGYSFFIFLNYLVDRIYWSTGQFVLGIIAGTTAVAIYAIAITFQTYYMSFSTAISNVFLPKITTMVTNNCSDKEVSDLFIKTGRVQFIIMSFILSGFILFGKAFINLWAGNGYKDSYIIALIIMVPLTLPLIQNLGITILQAKNQQKFRSLLYITISILSLGISIPLAKIYGGIGCAIGTSLALTAGNIIAMNIYYYKKVKINIPQFWSEISKMALPVMLITAIDFYVNTLIFNDHISGMVLKLCLFLAFYFPIVYKFGINQYEKDLILSVVSKFRIKKSI
jgi:O-antigen/teichoic acid export membrane protein